ARARVRSPAHRTTPPSPPHRYTLSLHDALPILTTETIDSAPTVPPQPPLPPGPPSGSSHDDGPSSPWGIRDFRLLWLGRMVAVLDRKSTRLNSSHMKISYAGFCLKKKNTDRNVV